MRLDLYTKTILTFLAVILAIAVLGPLLKPSPSMASGKFEGVQISAYTTGGGDCSLLGF